MDSWKKMSTNEEELNLVDSQDIVIGAAGKIEAHRAPGQLHRAFTVFLFDPQGRVLLTQRSEKKPLWPLWWDAACSSHQWPGENDETAAMRRLPFELGLQPTEVQDLAFQFSYEYHAVYNQDWAENEVNHILTGTLLTDPRINKDEVVAWEWATREKISEELTGPEPRFAPWFGLAWEQLG